MRTDGRGAVVVPAIEHPSSLACLRSLKRSGRETIVASHDESAIACSSRHCDRSVVVPSPHESATGYRDALLELAQRPEVETIHPVRESDVYLLAKYRDEFAPYVGTAWPSFEQLRTVHDRLALYDEAEAVGVPIPETKRLDDDRDRSRDWIVKGRYALLTDEYGEAGDGIARPPTTQYLPAGSAIDRDEIRRQMGHGPIVQEYLPASDEYGFFAIYDDGEAKATFQHRQIRGVHYTGGASAFREAVDVPELERLGLALLDRLEWHGVAMVEFKQNEDGEFTLMEVNPRFWSSLPFTVQAGADFPLYHCLLADGRGDRIDCRYDVGAAGHHLAGEASHLLSLLRDDAPLVERPAFTDTALDVLTSLLRHPRFDYLDPDDPLPFLRLVDRKLTNLGTTAVREKLSIDVRSHARDGDTSGTTAD